MWQQELLGTLVHRPEHYVTTVQSTQDGCRSIDIVTIDCDFEQIKLLICNIIIIWFSVCLSEWGHGFINLQAVCKIHYISYRISVKSFLLYVHITGSTFCTVVVITVHAYTLHTCFSDSFPLATFHRQR